MNTKKNIKYNLLGIKLDAIYKENALHEIGQFFNKKKASLLTTTNAEFIILSRDDEEFRNIINKKSSINFIDGFGIIWAIGLLKCWKPKLIIFKQLYIAVQWLLSILLMPISLLVFKKYVPEKISGSDFTWDLAKFAADNQKRVFLLGNKLGMDPNSAQKASLKLLTDIYNLKISGTHSGTDSVVEEKEIIEMIKKSDSDILMVGFGSPKQEKWLARNLKKTNCKIVIGLGGTFDFIAGIQKRAPRWVQKIGFEWLYRLFQNPRRFRRQISTLPVFLYLVLVERFKNNI